MGFCCYLIPAIVGIIVLINGQVMLTNNRKVRGWPARIIGVILLLPFPLTFFSAILIGLVNLALGEPMDKSGITSTSIFLVAGVFALCILAILGIAIAYSEPIRKRRVVEVLEEVDEPTDYGERFRATKGRRPTPKAKDADRTDEPPDDRIQQ